MSGDLAALGEVGESQGLSTQAASLHIEYQYGGAVKALAARETLAFIGVGPRVHVVDLSEPTSPVKLWTTPLQDGFVSDVRRHDEWLFTALDPGGLAVFHLVDGGPPRLVARRAEHVRAKAVFVAASQAHLLSTDELIFSFDIARPETPELLTRRTRRVTPNDFEARRGLAYARQRNGELLRLRANGSEVEVAKLEPNQAPRLVARYASPAVIEWPTLARGPEPGMLLASGLISGGEPRRWIRMSTFLVTRPKSWDAEIDLHELPAEASHLLASDGHQALFTRGQSIDVVRLGLNGSLLSRTTIREQDSPSADTSHPWGPHRGTIAADGTTAAAGGSRPGFGCPAIAMISLGNPSGPTRYHDFGSQLSRGVQALALDDSGELLAVSGTRNNCDVVYGDPDSYGTMQGPRLTTAHYTSGGGVAVFDVADKNAVRRVAGVATVGSSNDLAFHGRILALAAGREGFRLVDLSEPQQPRDLSTFDRLPGNAKQLALHWPLAFISFDHRVAMLDLSIPEHPRSIAVIDLPGAVHDLLFDGDMLWAATQDSGLIGIPIIRNSARPVSSLDLYPILPF